MENNTAQPTQPIINPVPQVPQDPTPAQPLPRHMHRKLALSILAIIAIIFLSGTALGVYSLTKNQTPASAPTPLANTPTAAPSPTVNPMQIPADWLKISTTDNKFSLSYPSGWSAKQEKEVQDTPYIFTFIKNGTPTIETIAIFVANGGVDQLKSGTLANQTENFKPTFEDGTLNGYKSTKATILEKINNPTTNQLEEADQYYVAFEKDGLTYEVQGDLKNKNIVDLMASSIKFNQ